MDEQIRQWWYLGLQGLARLVAASRNALGPRFGENGLDFKKLFTVRVSHPICAEWETGLGDTVEGILRQYLPGWSTLSVVRIGFSDEEAPTIVWIGIEPETADVHDAQMAVALISAQLARRQLQDVAVEIREATVDKLSSFIDWRSEQPDQYSEPFTVPLGSSFSSLSRPNATGSLGLSVTCDSSDGPVECFLTCKHCLAPRAEWRDTSLRPGDSCIREQYGILLEGDQFGNMLQSLDIAIGFVQKEMSKAQDNEEGLDTAAEKLQHLLKNKRRLLEDWSEPEDRVIGEAYAYAPLSLGSLRAPRAHGNPVLWTLDWGLMAKRGDRFENLPVNVVPFSVQELVELSLPVPGTVEAKPGFELLSVHNGSSSHVLPLQGTRPVSDIASGDYVVAKCGPKTKTGLTKGRTNAIQSRVRYPYHDGTAGVSRELLVLAVHPQPSGKPFSTWGDSGSTVFDLTGRVVGMVTSGSTTRAEVGPTERGSDETFVTPIDVIMKDMAGYVNNPRLTAPTMS